MRHWRPDENVMLWELFEKGKSDEEIAEIMGFAEGTIGAHRRKLGLIRRRDRHETRVDYDKVEELCKLGMSPEDVARKVGCTSGTVAKYRRRHGYGSWQKMYFAEVDRVVRQLWEQGMSDREIASAIGLVFPQSVGARRRKMGLKAHYMPFGRGRRKRND